jgi:3-methyl-2-oxobutanoate hydroxymethyltransferase
MLVGDSLGMVVCGRDSTVSVTLEEVVYHCQAVKAGATTPFIVADLPFGTYLTPDDAARNAALLLKSGGAESIKMEGGRRVIPQVTATVNAGIPTMGHVGLTPQTVSALSGFCYQGKTAETATQLLDDALALQDAGCFAIVLECVPGDVAAAITAALDIPTIGIGAGAQTSGQVQVSISQPSLNQHWIITTICVRAPWRGMPNLLVSFVVLTQIPTVGFLLFGP